MPVTLTFMAGTATWALATDFGVVVLTAEVLEEVGYFCWSPTWFYSHRQAPLRGFKGLWFSQSKMHLSLELWLWVAVLAADGVAAFRPAKSLRLAVRHQRALSMTRGDDKSVGLPNWLRAAMTSIF